MRIGIDARMIRHRMTGIGKYTQNLVQGLARVDQQNQYIILSNEPLGELKKNNPNFHQIMISQAVFSLSEQLIIPGIIRREKLDLFHTPSFVAPLWQPCSSVMTIHDLTHLRFPNLFSKKVQWYYRLIVRPAARKMKKIITDSETSKSDILSFLNIPEERIVVIPLGVDKAYKPQRESGVTSLLLKRFQISGNYILSLGNRKPHKNFIRLVEAFNLLEKETKSGYLLVILVDNDPRYRQIEKRVEELSLGRKVKVISDFFSEEELSFLYSAADLFVLPSLYEGFGLPVLEAMACGTPVVASNTSSLPEVVGDAGILVDPYDHRKIAQAMYQVLGDRALWNRLREKGLDRAKIFTWEKTARKTLEVYNQVYQAGMETRPT